jgi:predicted Zn-dependent peptidase
MYADKNNCNTYIHRTKKKRMSIGAHGRTRQKTRQRILRKTKYKQQGKKQQGKKQQGKKQQGKKQHHLSLLQQPITLEGYRTNHRGILAHLALGLQDRSEVFHSALMESTKIYESLAIFNLHHISSQQ